MRPSLGKKEVSVKLDILPAYGEAYYFDGFYLVLFGGGGSGKSYFAAQKILMRCLGEDKHRIVIVRKVLKTCRNSTFKQLKDVARDTGLIKLLHFGETEMSIRFENGNEILHLGLDDPEKVKSFAQPTSIWIEEATELTYQDFAQLIVRLRGNLENYKQIMLTFNPIDARHWLRRWLETKIADERLVVHTTWRDNVLAGEDYGRRLGEITDERMRKVYERGEWGELDDAIIIPHWEEIDFVPHSKKAEVCYGLDFGFNAPTALIKVTLIGDDVYAEEKLYRTNLTNPDLIKEMNRLIPDKNVPIYGDPAEPQRIEEIRRDGFNVDSADKDIIKGIDTLKSRSLRILRTSKNLMDELGSYKWSEYKEGGFADKPAKRQEDHAIDALRYAVHTRWGVAATYLWLLGGDYDEE